MGLYERLTGEQSPKISPHHILAGLGEIQRGRLTRADFEAGLALTPAESAELTTLLNTVAGNLATKLTRVFEIHDILLCGECQFPGYLTAADLRAKLGV